MPAKNPVAIESSHSGCCGNRAVPANLQSDAGCSSELLVFTLGAEALVLQVLWVSKLDQGTE